jgi:CubicO group peptidase (beta-lactamase class C family)
VADVSEVLAAQLAPLQGDGLPGAVALVARDGDVLAVESVGLASIEHRAPIGVDTVFHVASVSKQLTAFSVALLVADGRVDLDGDIRTWLPEVPDLGSTITPRHLLHHTSGLRDQWELLVMGGWRMEDVITTADVLDLVAAQRALSFEPGAEFSYCNTGYTLLAELVARVAGEPFADFGRARIFEPLGMASTHWHVDHHQVVPDSAQSYAPLGGDVLKVTLSYSIVGATSLWTSAGDLARWLANLRTGDVGGTAVRDLLRQPGVLHDGTELEYAAGLMTTPHRGAAALSHSGGDAGFRAFAMTLPDHDLDVVVLSNHAFCDPAAIARAAVDAALGDVLGAAPAQRPLEETSAAALEWAGTYFDPTSAAIHTVRSTGTHLTIDTPMPVPLVPVTGDRLQAFGMPHIELRFRRDGAGAVLEADSMFFHTCAERIDDAPSHQDPATLVGRYHSDELDVTWSIEQRGADALVLTRRKYGSMPLHRIRDGLFRTDFDMVRQLVALTIELAGDGTMLVSSPRARRVRFRRIDAG